jgi:hypothetical protein
MQYLNQLSRGIADGGEFTGGRLSFLSAWLKGTIFETFDRLYPPLPGTGVKKK